MAVPRESKDVPIPPVSDSGKRRAMKAATVDAEQWQITVGKQPCNGRRVKNGCRGRKRETNPEVRQNRSSGEES